MRATMNAVGVGFMLSSTLGCLEGSLPKGVTLALSIIGALVVGASLLLESGDTEAEEKLLEARFDLCQTRLELLKERRKNIENDRSKKIILCYHPCKRKIR